MSADKYGIDVPLFDVNDPAEMEAWFGNFGHGEHYRKVVLENCAEMVRADYELREEKITEARITILKRVHPSYLAYLTDSLHGRIARERNAIESLRHGA